MNISRRPEQEAVVTTIVGGRPPGCGTSVGNIPRGIEVLVKKAAVDPEFRKTLLEHRAGAAGEIELTLTPAEAMMLAAVPVEQLRAIIDRTQVNEESRRAFLGKAAAVMLAALGGAVAGAAEPDSQGIRPDVPVSEGVRPDVPVSKGVRPDTGAISRGARPDIRPPATQAAQAKLVCTLKNIPPKGYQGSKVVATITILNPGKEPVQFLPWRLDKEKKVCTGTILRVQYRKVDDAWPARPAGGKEVDGVWIVTGEVTDKDHVFKALACPSDAAEPVLLFKAPAPDDPPQTMTVLVTLPPVGPGKADLRAVVESFVCTGNAADPAENVDLKAIKEQFLQPNEGAAVRVDVMARPSETPVDGIRPDNIRPTRGVRPDIPGTPRGGSRPDIPPGAGQGNQ